MQFDFDFCCAFLNENIITHCAIVHRGWKPDISNLACSSTLGLHRSHALYYNRSKVEYNWGGGVVVTASAWQSVNLGFIPFSSYTKYLKNEFYKSIAWLSAIREMWKIKYETEIIHMKPNQAIIKRSATGIYGLSTQPFLGPQQTNKHMKNEHQCINRVFSASSI